MFGRQCRRKFIIRSTTVSQPLGLALALAMSMMNTSQSSLTTSISTTTPKQAQQTDEHSVAKSRLLCVFVVCCFNEKLRFKPLLLAGKTSRDTAAVVATEATDCADIGDDGISIVVVFIVEGARTGVDAARALASLVVERRPERAVGLVDLLCLNRYLGFLFGRIVRSRFVSYSISIPFVLCRFASPL